jgi:hypothetical protein
MPFYDAGRASLDAARGYPALATSVLAEHLIPSVRIESRLPRDDIDRPLMYAATGN